MTKVDQQENSDFDASLLESKIEGVLRAGFEGLTLAEIRSELSDHDICAIKEALGRLLARELVEVAGEEDLHFDTWRSRMVPVYGLKKVASVVSDQAVELSSQELN